MTQTLHVTTPALVADSTMQEYRTHGFVRIPHILSPEEVTHFHHAAQAAAERLRHKDLSRSAVFTQLVNVWQEDEAMRALTLHPNAGSRSLMCQLSVAV